MRIIRRRSGNIASFTVEVDANKTPGFVVKNWRRSEPGSDDPAARRSGVRGFVDRLFGGTSPVNPPPPRRKLVIKPQRSWEEHGWRLNGNRYEGEYRAGNQTWRGYARTPPTHNYRGEYDFFILNPPNGVKNHACWHGAGGEWYWVNFHTPPPDLLSGIKFVEDFLAQVTGVRR